MNDFELFLNFGAVVKIRRFYEDDLYKFVKLMLNNKFMNEYITYFINACKILDDKKVANNLSIQGKLELLEENYTNDYFWHLVDINEGKLNSVCIEYQVGKGFTFGKEKDYTDYDNSIKVLSIDELIMASGMTDEFNLDYTETTFEEELEKIDKELADELDSFCEFYEWLIVKYPNGLYNILDTQTDEFVGNLDGINGNGTLREVIVRVFDRMVSYFEYEDDIDGLIEEGSIDYIEENINKYIKLGKQYNLCSEDEIKHFEEFLKECKEESKEVKEN